jgi:hypothetical protein
MPKTAESPLIQGSETGVLDTLARANGKTESPRMSPLDILVEDARRSGIDPNAILQALAEMKQDPNIETVQIGNTLFVVNQVTPGHVQFEWFTVEDVGVLIERIKSLMMLLKRHGMVSAETYSDDPSLQGLTKVPGLTIDVSQTVKSVGSQMKPVYSYMVRL